jgi:hypothetical protein
MSLLPVRPGRSQYYILKVKIYRDAFIKDSLELLFINIPLENPSIITSLPVAIISARVSIPLPDRDL